MQLWIEGNPVFSNVVVLLYFSFLLGLMKCPGGPQCPVCASPSSLKNQALLEQTGLTCISPVIPSAGREMSTEAEVSEIDSVESFIEPLGSASLDLSDHQGNNVDLRCNISQSSEIQDSSFLDLSVASPAPLPLALSLILDCPVDRQGYEKLWRILAYYSETAVHLERQIMLSKAPSLAYRYRQAAETDGYYHSGVRASVKAKPEWLLQSAISIQLDRAHSNARKVQLMYSTRVSTHLDLASTSNSLPISKPWVMILTNTTTAFAAAAGHTAELPCPLLSSGNPKVHWILPDGSQHFPTHNGSDSRLQISASSLVLHKVQLSDAGIYYCIARTERDVDVLPLRLAVEDSSVPPSGEPIGLSITSAVGEPVILSCKASGSPEPRTSWLLPDGKIISQGVAASRGVILHPNGSLLLPNPSRKDAGYYRCIAVSQYGSDALSTQVELNTKHHPLLKIPFPRGPQSAAGRSTRIRAPLLHEIGEGSADEEEKEDQTLSSRKGQPRPVQPLPNRRYPGGNFRRRGSVRGPLRRGPSPDQRRNHLQNRFRVNTNKQRIDPQKWADLLAKIRQKTEHTSNNQTNRTEKPNTEEIAGNSVNIHNNTEGEGVAGAALESETEGSSADVSDLQEEGLQPIYSVVTEKKTHSMEKNNAGIDLEIKNGVVMSTTMPTDINNSRETYIQTENVGPQTEIVTNPDSRKEVTSQTISTTNTILLKPNEGGEQKSNPTKGPYKNQQRLPNLVPNSRPQSPWNSRRRFGHRRRIMHRPGLPPLTPLQTHPHRSNTKSPTETLELPTEQTNWLLLPPITSSSTSLFTQNIQSGNAVEQNSFNLPFSHTLSVSTSKSDAHLVTSSPSSLTSVSPTHADRVTLPTKNPEATDFTQAPSQSDNTITVTDVSDTSAKTHKHGLETDTETQTVLGIHREKLERNLLKPFVPYSSTLSSTISTSITSSTVPISSITMAATEKITPSVTTQNSPLSSTSVTEIPWMTTSTPVTSRPILSTIAAVKQAVYSTTRTPTTTLHTTAARTPSLPSTAATQTTPVMRTSATPVSHTFISTTTHNLTTVPTSTKTESAALSTSKISTTMGDTTSAPSTSITTPIKSLSGGRTVIDEGGRPVPGVLNQSQFSTDWKNPGVNSIPDSHSSRLRKPLSPLLPAAPGVSPTKSKCIILYCIYIISTSRMIFQEYVEEEHIL